MQGVFMRSLEKQVRRRQTRGCCKQNVMENAGVGSEVQNVEGSVENKVRTRDFQGKRELKW